MRACALLLRFRRDHDAIHGRFVWVAPTTVLGAVVVLAGRARLRVVDGVLEAHGPTLAWLLAHLLPIPGGPAALTLGHVVVGGETAVARGDPRP